MVPLSGPIIESYPGKPVESSVITPLPDEWWLRPVISAARVGEHSAVELNWVYRSPDCAIRSSAGVRVELPIRHGRAVDPEPVHRDGMYRGLLRVVLVGAHAERTGGNE